jgi:phage gp29-like protein
MTMKILDQYGNPIDRGALAQALSEPQTARITTLENQFLTPMLAGLTPTRLSAVLKAADDGDLTSQHRLFADMEERDAHLLCEIGKRKLAVMDLDWDIAPPRNATAAEKANAEWLKEVLQDAVDPFEDLLLALMDGVGHGFATTELEWRREGKEWLPAFHPRPQEWFRLDRLRRELRLQDASADGAPLVPFGWVLHTHGKAKTGYLGRMGLHRALVWPFLYKAYSLGDFAEFLETYGLPIVLGKYYQGANADEKASLMRAVTALGHDARAIMPADMSIEINKVTADGSGTPHLAMIAWADAAQSKAVLGQVLSAEAKATGMGSGVADLHAEVRHDIRNADARQIAGTVTRDLLYPLLALNRGGIDSLARCPHLVFDTGEAEDITLLADGVEKLTKAGMRSIPVKWVHEKLRIPEPTDGEATLGPTPPPLQGEGGAPAGPADEPAAARAALAGAPPVAAGNSDLLAAQLADATAPDLARWIQTVRAMLDGADSLEQFRANLLAAYPQLDASGVGAALRAAMITADLAGRWDVATESGLAQRDPAPQQITLAATLALPESVLAALAAAQPAAPTVIENHVHVPAAAPSVIENHVHVPETVVHVAAAEVTVNNEVLPAPVNTVVTHPTRAIQTVERDPGTLEVDRTVTVYEHE